jgi:UDP-glucuronate decarboxylase
MNYNEHYYKELEKVNNSSFIDWDKFNNKCILITGSTGMIGSFLVDTLMLRNETYKSNITIIANSSNQKSIDARFSIYSKNEKFKVLIQNVMEPLNIDFHVDYIIHAASNAYPELYDKDPVGTMMGNFIGLKNILDYSIKNNVKRVLYVSSGEIYGKNEKNKMLSENDYGFVDILKSRSCYPMGKRASETLAVCYSKQYDCDIVIARPCHIFGPTATLNDNRISSLFVRNALKGENIVLKSNGLQKRSYCYVTDCCSALLTILDKGNSMEAYNISNSKSIITISELAHSIAKMTKTEVIFDIPSDNEKKNFNSMDYTVLNNEKLLKLGWMPMYDFESALKNNILILKN